MTLKAFITGSAILCGSAIPGLCAEVFVVEAKGVDLIAGQILDGTKPLALAVGQRVTFVTSDGRTIKLKGPSNSPPAPDEASKGADVVDSLRGLIKAREADTTSAGIIRQGGTIIAQPTPWLLEVGHSGDRCQIDGERTVLWRTDTPTVANDLEITPIDHSWTADASWPAGSDKLALPPTMTLHNGQTYVVSLDGVSVNLTVHIIPQTVKSEAAKAAWMIEVGCESQAVALVGTMR
jgi:hypothetical protein